MKMNLGPRPFLSQIDMKTNASLFTSQHLRTIAAIAVVAIVAGCASAPPNPNPRAAQELKLAKVDLPRYMGTWYVIANIPYFGEKNYVGSRAEWKLRDDGRIADAFIGRKGGFDQPETRREFVDTVVPGTDNARWSVRLFWPVSVTQLTLYVDDGYEYTLLGYPGKSLGWIFARRPDIGEAKFRELLEKMNEQGYDTSRFQRVPQKPEQIGLAGFQSPEK